MHQKFAIKQCIGQIKKIMHEFKEAMPVVVALRNKELKDYH